MKRPVTYIIVMIVIAGIWLGETGKVFSRDVHSLQDEQEVAVAVSDIQATTIPRDLSPVGMFISADRIVQVVMLGLLFASALTWTIWIAKSIELASVRRRARKVVEIILYAKSLENAVAAMQKEKGSGVQLVRAAAEEVRISIAAVDDAGNNGLKERIASLLMRIELQAGRHISRGMGILATIASVSPFVGLFGTVWGIMNSFIGISHTQTTSLAVVAPGIAEALLATAIGLVAAIPAVIIYNVFARSISGYKQILADASAGIERLASRDLDFYKTDKKSDKTIRSKITE